LGHFFLSHLLPYDPAIKKQSRLKNGLNESLFLLVAAEESMKSFQRGELSKFDPLVGENSCQIRAVKVALLASKKSLNIEEMLEEISCSRNIINELLESIDDFSTQEKSLRCFIESHNIDIFMSKDAIFLIQSYILSKTKLVLSRVDTMTFLRSEKTRPLQIKEFGDVSRDFIENLIKTLRNKLSESSARFVQELSKCPLLAEGEIETIIKDFSISHKELSCTPFYWMTKVIMHQAFVSKIPIIIFAEQVAQDLEYEDLEKTAIVFYPTESGYRVVPRDFLEEDQPIMVFTVVSCRDSCDFSDKETWKEELIEHDLLDLVLACSAAHRQYPDPSKEHLIQEVSDESYAYHLEKSYEWGCHIDNPSCFFLTHIYCDNTNNV